MHACLLHIYDHVLLHLLSIDIYPRGSVMALCTFNLIQTEIDPSSCLCHPFGYVTFRTLKLPNGLLADSFL
jgi:hypothetical protein